MKSKHFLLPIRLVFGTLSVLLTFLLAACANNGPPGSISGWVFHDVCDSGREGDPPLTAAPAGCIESPSPIGAYHADGIQDPMEPPIAGVIVSLGRGACPSTGYAEIMTIDTDLSYSFMSLPPGQYCVSIDLSNETNRALLSPGIWTYPQVSEDIISTTVDVAPNRSIFDISFGWDFQFLP